MLTIHLINTAKAVALSGTGVGGSNGFRLGAIITDKKSNILIARTNSYKTHPKLVNWYPYPYLHAEAACILGLGLDSCEGKTIIVSRVLRDNSLALAKPCSSCMNLIEIAKIKTIIFSTGNGYDRIQCR